jgi:hypothetical protein
MPDSEFQSSYPKWLYTKQGGEVVGRIVNDPKERAALGKGWAETPDGPFPSETMPRPRGRPRTRS